MYISEKKLMKTITLFQFLDQLSLMYECHSHEAVYTVQDANHLKDIIPGAHSKNLFLKDKKKAFYLVSVLEHKRVDLKALSKVLGKGGLSFANDEDLLENLNVTPGSVTPFGLMHDQSLKVTFVLDRDFLNDTIVNFHPLRNDMTISIGLKEFLHFLDIIEHHPIIMDIPTMNGSSEVE